MVRFRYLGETDPRRVHRARREWVTRDGAPRPPRAARIAVCVSAGRRRARRWRSQRPIRGGVVAYENLSIQTVLIVLLRVRSVAPPEPSASLSDTVENWVVLVFRGRAQSSDSVPPSALIVSPGGDGPDLLEPTELAQPSMFFATESLPPRPRATPRRWRLRPRCPTRTRANVELEWHEGGVESENLSFRRSKPGA